MIFFYSLYTHNLLSDSGRIFIFCTKAEISAKKTQQVLDNKSALHNRKSRVNVACLIYNNINV